VRADDNELAAKIVVVQSNRESLSPPPQAVRDKNNEKAQTLRNNFMPQW
jgi:hypothetical protein